MIAQSNECMDVMNLTDNDYQLYNDYMALFKQYSWNNDLYGTLTYFTVMGQNLKFLRIQKGVLTYDLRVSPFLIQKSGTGKGTGARFVIDLMQQLGKRVQKVIDFTDSGIVGKVEAFREFNRETRQWEQNTREVYGALHENDLIFFPEASSLLRNSQHKVETLNYIQTALESPPSNRIERVMANGTLSYKTTCSFLLTSYPIKGIAEWVGNTGLFQRMIVCPRNITRKTRRENRERDVITACSKGVTPKTTVRNIKGLSKRFLEIENHYQENPSIHLTSNLAPFINTIIDDWESMADRTHPDVQDLFDSFIARYIQHLYVISIHQAASRLSTRVKQDDIIFANEQVLLPVLRNILSWIEIDLKINKYDREEIRKLNLMLDWWDDIEKGEDKKVSSTVLNHELSEIWGCSPSAANQYIKRFVSLGYIRKTPDPLDKRMQRCEIRYKKRIKEI